MAQSDSPSTESPYLSMLAHTVVQLPGLIVLKDLESRVVAMNDALATLLGLQSATVARGRYEHELSACLETAVSTFREQDQATISQKHLRSVDVLAYNDGRPRAILSEKVCIYDPQGRPQAVLFQGTDISSQVFGTIGALLLQHVDKMRQEAKVAPASYALDRVGEHRPLGEREGECLFYLLRGKTARGIGEILHLSPRTVEDYIERLKYVFGCSTKAELIEKAIDEGYSHFLPPSLLRKTGI